MIAISCQSAPCQNEADTIISYVEQFEKGHATKILGSCNDCLEKVIDFDLGHKDIYRQYPGYKLLMSVDDLTITAKNMECEKKNCFEKATTSYVGIILCNNNTNFYWIFYRCDEHKLEDSKNWKNLKIIKLGVDADGT